VEPLKPEAQRFLDMLLGRKRRAAAEYVLERAGRGGTVEEVHSTIVLPALNRVGALWQQNRISVADEHAATEIGRYTLFRLLDGMPREKPLGAKALVACVPGEEHDIGAQIASGMLEAGGWDVIYVGRSAPEEEILKVFDSERPGVAVFAIAMIARLPAARDLFDSLRSKFADIKIIAGGRAALAAQQVFGMHTDAVVKGTAELNEVALRLVGKHA
jgi:methanogenic corrinoid protein MtbC1